MQKRRIYLGDYELIGNNWTSPRVTEGTVRLIEGILYHAIDYMNEDLFDPCKQEKGTIRSQWVRINIVADDSKE